ncbi:PEP-CTERM sorting domain-containing protein [Roseateles sp.]|uniref:PEP-CTERM sorting domain-containing protein n=1 Tax=Roseateles sp. TaxID=1971397 RepID=UPI0032638481
MTNRRWLTAFVHTFPLLASVVATPNAQATVTVIQAGADTHTQAGIDAPDTVSYGPSDRSFDISLDPYVVSKSDSRIDHGMTTAIASAGSAVQFNGPDNADFFVRSSVNADAGVGAFQFPAHGSASGSAFYDFSVSTESTLSFTFAAYPSGLTPSTNSYVALNLFSADTHTYLRQGLVTGLQTLSYIVPAGNYGVTLTAFAEGTIPAHLTANAQAVSGATANLSLSISAVPEPATGALMLFGLCAVGEVRRQRLKHR